MNSKGMLILEKRNLEYMYNIEFTIQVCAKVWIGEKMHYKDEGFSMSHEGDDKYTYNVELATCKSITFYFLARYLTFLSTQKC
jgi:hypothetical protein